MADLGMGLGDADAKVNSVQDLRTLYDSVNGPGRIDDQLKLISVPLLGVLRGYDPAVQYIEAPTVMAVRIDCFRVMEDCSLVEPVRVYCSPVRLAVPWRD